MEHCMGELLSGCGAHSSDCSYVLVILNYRLPSLAALLWQRARLRMCADGGANRLYNELPLLLGQEESIVRERFIPDAIIGDLDSILPEVRQFYESRGTAVLDKSHDQDTVDLHKCISFVAETTTNPASINMKILVVGALGGRFDHEMGNINVLFSFRSFRIILFNDESLVFLLPRDVLHTIHVSPEHEGPNCGIIPLGRPCTATTTGLKWNLNQTSMEFGGLVSTSNMFASDKVTVSSDSDLLWTSSIKPRSGT
ncbi:hypothetical protein SELMODRAFT_235596 [Selaginella moellendorffii]|uniref:Thiamine pyrophosphokinase n=1 Tax=Selaginella moellendorffii TaxID=88036 RepID=D8SZC8_SELML|nr:thiamine pyrophosphokinase 3 [Selaginella moellendorffii]XP_024518346.1 thiamine pyrophosphokinase 3 [Selaginella moellendorffii]EFJ10261.1 hypothetical protein SELMODRAFT_235596 [Selaginella moellendorffii]|eukprot:XP_002988750.1 thiamine pyrophosphokinase 3 [Selaginella moellendorffii]